MELKVDMSEADLARLAGSRHLGMPGERTDFKGLKVFMAEPKDTMYGPATLLCFEDPAGNVLVWFATGEQPHAVGDMVDLRATVKGYEDSGGVRKTVVYRAVKPVDDGKPKWSARAAGAGPGAARRRR